MPKKVKIILMALGIMAIIALVVSLTIPPKQYLIVDGCNNIAYKGAINTVFNEGLDSADYEPARIAHTYIADRAVDYVVLINPSVENVLDFYSLAKEHGAKLIIGDTSNEEELKAELFNLGFSGKKIKFKTNREWKPDGESCFY